MVSDFPERSVAAPRQAKPTDAAGGSTRWACADLLEHKWALQIVAVLLAGPRRFSALRAAVPGLSDKVLSQRLRELEMARVVSRAHFAEIPPRVEYALTPAGYALRGVIGEMERWSREHPLSSANGHAPQNGDRT